MPTASFNNTDYRANRGAKASEGNGKVNLLLRNSNVDTKVDGFNTEVDSMNKPTTKSLQPTLDRTAASNLFTAVPGKMAAIIAAHPYDIQQDAPHSDVLGV